MTNLPSVIMTPEEIEQAEEQSLNNERDFLGPRARQIF